MPFARRFGEIMAKSGTIMPLRLWLRTLWFSGMMLAFCAWYLSITEPGTLPVIINKALADGAMILIGLSFALSGLCYFWDFLDRLIIYRKYLGLAGFAFGLAHAIMSLVFYLWWKPRGYETNPIFVLDHQWDFGVLLVSNLYAFAAALVALAIFIMMAAISNRYAIEELGGIWWRRLLRVGYLAYVSATIHFFIKNFPDWRTMFEMSVTVLPPMNFMIFLLVCGVIALRLALTIAIWQKKQTLIQNI